MYRHKTFKPLARTSVSVQHAVVTRADVCASKWDTAGTKILLSNDPNCQCYEIYGVKRKKFLRQSHDAQAVDLRFEIASENHFTSLHDFHRNDSRLVFLLWRLFFIRSIPSLLNRTLRVLTAGACVRTCPACSSDTQGGTHPMSLS